MGSSDFLRQVSLLMSLPAVLLVGLSAALVVVVRDWRLAILSFAVFSASISLLLTQVIPTEWALLHVIVGALISIMLLMSGSQLRATHLALPSREWRWPQMASLSPFRTLTIALAAFAYFSLREHITLPITNSALQDAVLWPLIVGLLGLGMHEEPLHAGLSLLIMLAGFCVLIFSLSQHQILVGLIEAWQLLLGLAIAYLTVSRGLSVPPTNRDEVSW
jgi:hypothetical protein